MAAFFLRSPDVIRHELRSGHRSLGISGQTLDLRDALSRASAPIEAYERSQNLDKSMIVHMATCAFCGYGGKLTGEHVLGNWLGNIGLDPESVPHGAGPLNQLGRDLGVRPPFRQTVRDVCGDCNNGWMSRLENIARRTLASLIVGEPGILSLDDQGAVAAWVQKTALTAMLVSSEKNRADGHGVPVSEYHDLYARRNAAQPLADSQFWIGRYEGVRGWSIRVTPLAVRMYGVPEPAQPQGYAMTVVIGQLVLHGVRFTTPSLHFDVSTSLGMPQIWPPTGLVRWPDGQLLDDAAFLGFAGGKNFRSFESHLELRPWRPATELKPSQTVGPMVALPTICGKHTVYYPLILVEEAMRGRFYVFGTACECGTAYLIQTESDGAHCKAAGTTEAVSELLERLSGEDLVIQDDQGIFDCRRVEPQ